MQANQIHNHSSAPVQLHAVHHKLGEAQPIEGLVAAYTLGTQSCNDRYPTVPAKFNTAPALLAAWSEGRKDQEMMKEMQECRHCSNASGDPCVIHD